MHKQNTHDENGMLQAELVPKVVLKCTNRIHMMKIGMLQAELVPKIV